MSSGSNAAKATTAASSASAAAAAPLTNKTAAAAAAAATPATSKKPSVVTADSVRADLLLPALHDIVRVVEKDNQEVSQKTKDSLEASHRVVEIAKRVEALREDIYRLPGVERSAHEQRAHLRTLKRQLRLKKELIAKYKGINYKAAGLAAAAAAAAAAGGSNGSQENT